MIKILVEIASYENKPGKLYFNVACHSEHNRAELEKYFNSSESLDEICIMNKVDGVEYDEDALHDIQNTARCLLMDLKDDESELNKYFEKNDENQDPLGRKLSIFNKVFVKILVSWGRGRLLNEMSDYACFYYENYYFHAYIPKERLREVYGTNFKMRVSINDFPKEDAIQYFFTSYYIERGAWDREELLNDFERSEFISKNWIKNLRCSLN